eukprot:3644768-Rhodomonas_salina.1
MRSPCSTWGLETQLFRAPGTRYTCAWSRNQAVTEASRIPRVSCPAQVTNVVHAPGKSAVRGRLSRWQSSRSQVTAALVVAYDNGVRISTPEVTAQTPVVCYLPPPARGDARRAFLCASARCGMSSADAAHRAADPQAGELRTPSWSTRLSAYARDTRSP